ncbi:MAG TPA: carboxypeptidase regulatory-like domain-containing protein [Acidobacteriota bacterium]|nr:carboxypeptidase regulatory-like domain-containing protein [Acidobacteriota bacterium]
MSFRLRGGDSLRAPRLREVVTLLLVVAALVLPGMAQAQTGTIQGKVLDQNGVPLQGVSVIVVGAQTGGFSNAAGEFKILRVPVGTFTVRAIIASHERQDKPVKIDANRATEINFTLSVNGSVDHPALAGTVSRCAFTRVRGSP